MKAVFIFIFLFVGLSANSQWTQVYTNSTGSWRDILSLSASTDGGVLAVRRDDYIYSVNGATSWSFNSYTNLTCCSSWKLISGSLYNKDTFALSGYCNASNYAGMAITLNGNASFTCWHNTTSNDYTKEKIFIGKNGIVMQAGDSKVYVSNDYGLNFSPGLTTGTITTARFLNDSIGAVLRTNELWIYHRLNNTGRLRYLPLGTTGRDVQMTDSTTIYLVTNASNGSNIYKSTNGGLFWSKLFLSDMNGNNDIKGIFFIDSNNGYAYGDKFLMRTTDGGAHWQIERFNTFTLQKVFFTDMNNGYLGGKISSTTKVYKTVTGGGAWADFNYFFMSNAACCANIICNINASFTAGNTYSWLLDGSLVATGGNPGTITMGQGNHTLALVSTNGIETDTFSTSVYSAPPLAPTFTITGIGDTTICNGSQFTFNASSTVSGYKYYMYDGANQLYGPVSGNGGTRYLYSGALYDTTLITMFVETQYPYCPGNSATRNLNVYVYPNTAETPPYFLEDTVCYEETASFVIPNSNTAYTYQVKSDGCMNHNSNPSSTIVPIVAPIDIHYYNGCTDNFYYHVTDSYGCTYDSDKVRLFVDSVHARLYSDASFGYVGDTVWLRGNSEGDFQEWTYDHSFLTHVDSSWNLNGFKILNGGKSEIRLKISNTSDCFEKSFQFISGFDSLPSQGNTLCASMSTGNNPGTLYGEMGCKSYNTYNKFVHVDRHGNSYLYGLTSVNINQVAQGSSVVIKMDSLGNMQWTKEIALTSYNLSDENLFINAVVTDSKGNVYVSGKYEEQGILLDGVNIPDANVSYPGAGFLCKLSATGNLVWFNVFNVNCSNENCLVSNVKVLNDTTLIMGAYNVLCMHQYPFSGITWTNPSTFYDRGMLVLNEKGEFKKLTYIGDYYETLLATVDPCYSTSALDFPYGMDYEIIGNRMYQLSLHRLSVGGLGWNGTNYVHTNYSSNGIMEGVGILTIFDTNGTVVLSKEAFRYILNDTLYNYSDDFYTSGPADDGDWSGQDEGFSEPRLATDGKSNIYVTFTAVADRIYRPALFTDSVYRSATGYYETQNGFINGSFNTSVIVKFDSMGNEQFRLYNDGVVIKDIAVSKGNELNCIGDFANFFRLNSTDGANYGELTQPYTMNGLFFRYDENGILLSYDPIIGSGKIMTGGIGTADTCNSNVYFSFVTNTSAEFQGSTYADAYNFYMMKVNNHNDCGDLTFCIPDTVTNLSVDNEEKNPFWQLMPNPASSKIWLISSDLKTSSNYSIDIYNSIGIKVDAFSLLNGNVEFDIAAYTNGFYFLVITDKSGNFIHNLSFIKE